MHHKPSQITTKSAELVRYVATMSPGLTPCSRKKCAHCTALSWTSCHVYVFSRDQMQRSFAYLGTWGVNWYQRHWRFVLTVQRESQRSALVADFACCYQDAHVIFCFLLGKWLKPLYHYYTPGDLKSIGTLNYTYQAPRNSSLRPS
jgi:hypothetical protein